VAASQAGAGVVVRVSDEGIGIDDDDAQLIFERFYQAGAGDRRRFGGLGLGLYIVRRLVEAQGGSVRAYGTPGIGATVEFTLPVAAAGADGSRAAALPEPPAPEMVTR
jgi:signal transduction histidine kinase